MKKKFIIGISLVIAIIMAIVLPVFFSIGYSLIAEKAESEFENSGSMLDAFGEDDSGFDGFGEESYSSFGRVNYGDFDEIRNQSIPRKTCYIKLLDYLYGRNCAYTGNVRNVTYHSLDLKKADINLNYLRRYSKRHAVYFSEKGDSIVNSSYYDGQQEFRIYNDGLIEKQHTNYINKEKSEDVNYYYDKDKQLIKVIHQDSFSTKSIETYEQETKQKKHILNSNTWKTQWIWNYDDNNRLIEKTFKIISASDKNFNGGLLASTVFYKLWQFNFSGLKYVYSYDKDKLYKVESFGKEGKRIGTLKFKDSNTKKRWDYTSTKVHFGEEHIYDDKNRPKKIIAYLKDYSDIGEENRVVLFDTLSNIISDSLFEITKISYLVKGTSTDVKKKRYSLDGRLEGVEHIIRDFYRRIPLIGFGFTEYETRSQSFIYDIKYDSIGNPNKITRKHFVDNQLLEHTEFTFDYEYYGLYNGNY